MATVESPRVRLSRAVGDSASDNRRTGSRSCDYREPMVRVALALSSDPGGIWSRDDKSECMARALVGVGAPRAIDAVIFPPGRAPTVGQPGNCVLSLSHSGPWLLCAAAREMSCSVSPRLGVDLEHDRPRGFEAICRALHWPGASKDPSHFYRRWTLAESMYKAVGAEWRELFELFDDVTRETARRHESDAGGFRWQVWWPRLVTGCTICVVSGAPI